MLAAPENYIRSTPTFITCSDSELNQKVKEQTGTFTKDRKLSDINYHVNDKVFRLIFSPYCETQGCVLIGKKAAWFNGRLICQSDESYNNLVKRIKETVREAGFKNLAATRSTSKSCEEELIILTRLDQTVPPEIDQ